MQLKHTPGWQVLTEMLSREAGMIPKPVDQDSKIAWEFETIRLQAINEVMSRPDQQIHLIGRNNR